MASPSAAVVEKLGLAELHFGPVKRRRGDDLFRRFWCF